MASNDIGDQPTKVWVFLRRNTCPCGLMVHAYVLSGELTLEFRSVLAQIVQQRGDSGKRRRKYHVNRAPAEPITSRSHHL